MYIKIKDPKNYNRLFFRKTTQKNYFNASQPSEIYKNFEKKIKYKKEILG